MKIYLAGDSIVQNYEKEEFIAGWGQFLPRFFKPDVNVFNYAKGGRSSRLFINEGRFEEIDRHIQSGDYLFIEFCHNDDDSKDYKSMFNRQTPLGVPDESGRFPVIAGVKMPTNYIPPEYIEALNNDDSITDKQAVLNSVLAINQSYPYDTYYPYSKDASMGSYKWFIKQFIDMARKHDAVPVLVTAPARTFFNADGTIMDAPGCHGGNNFSYIRAMRQIGEETGTPVLDLFSYSVNLFEKIGHALLVRTRKMWQLVSVLVALCFFSSMLITNDVSLITFVPFAIMMLKQCGRWELMIPVVVLQTLAANLGSMLTPIGNPQNLYLYTSGRLTALDFLTLLAPYAAVALALLLALCLLLPKERVAVDTSARAPLARKMLTLYGALSALALLAIAKVLPAWALAAAVFLGTLALDRGTIRQVDYTLLATFVCFFVFVASVKACVPVRAWLEAMMARSPMAVALLTSQVISNVPACLLLSPFTQDAKALALGVDLGGLGTLIASLASLISFRLYGAGEGAQKGRYFAVFTGVNVLFLAVMLGLAAIL